MILTTPTSEELAKRVAKRANLKLGKITLANFPNQDLRVTIDEPRRRKRAVIISSMHHNVLEVLWLTNATRATSNAFRVLSGVFLTLGVAKVARDTVKAAIDFEDAFAGVRKTVDATEAEFEQLNKQLITLSKKDNLASMRLLMRRISKDAAYKLHHEIGPRYKDRNGGYTRIVKTAKSRKRDGSSQVIIEFV